MFTQNNRGFIFNQVTTGVDVVVSTLSQHGLFLQPNLTSPAAGTGVKRFLPSEFSANIEQAPR